MDEKLKAVLMADEVVKWTGRPEPSKLLDAPYKKSLITTWIVSAVLTIVLWILLLPFAFASDGFRKEPVILLVAVTAMIGFIAVQPILEKRRLESGTIYAITNSRVLILNKVETLSFLLNGSVRIKVENRHDGCGNICLNEMIGKPVHKTRSFRALCVKSEDADKKTLGLMLYNVKSPDEVCGYLSENAA